MRLEPLLQHGGDRAVDISHHQPTDPRFYDQLARDFGSAIVRTTYGRTADREYVQHITELQSRGVEVWPYHFVRHAPGQTAAVQAAAIREALLEAEIRDMGEKRVCLDLEWNERFDGAFDGVYYRQLVRDLVSELGGWDAVFLYTSGGFWQYAGADADWFGAPWWVAHWVEAPSSGRWLFDGAQIRTHPGGDKAADFRFWLPPEVEANVKVALWQWTNVWAMTSDSLRSRWVDANVFLPGGHSLLYRPGQPEIGSGDMAFGEAISKVISHGRKASRRGWNGTGMYIYAGQLEGHDPFVTMHTASNTEQPGWLASQADMFADDWVLLE